MVVLAAGRGSRLGALGDSTPKWLLDVGGRTLADRQLEGIFRAAGAVASVRVVVGHAAEAIEDALAARQGEPVALVANPEYAQLNNWWSLLRALRELPDDGPVVALNADLLVDPDCVRAFVEAGATGAADAALAIDFERDLTDESMKVSRRPPNLLDAIGKAGVDEPVGEYVGMLMARGDALRALRAELESFVGRPDAANEWYERAVGLSARRGTAWELWPLPGGAWVEIDDDADLDRAQSLAARA